MAKSTYLRNKELDHRLGGAAFTQPAPFISLHTADPGLTGASEVSGGAGPYITALLAGTGQLAAEGEVPGVTVEGTAQLDGVGDLAAEGTTFLPQPIQVEVGGGGSWRRRRAAVAIVEGQAELHAVGALVASAICVIQASAVAIAPQQNTQRDECPAAAVTNDDDEVISLAVLYLLAEDDPKT